MRATAVGTGAPDPPRARGRAQRGSPVWSESRASGRACGHGLSATLRC